ncbi:hypothetical protein MCOR25_009235 [Pyricularia grisea]|uniref:Methyltransferase small domain-containing protein n=1 Tax=Pyricularia grisea TaxID=148305 RepID=A0A6P8B940_PYRGI|nr:uncharacterized protein PgNI_04721 [Pyricularia grisea]KAI6352974.1 hypothetical protein MCOR25_009235 [Pyricularia grisea]TLD12162.1 hypothetical protein PgNI_04721 [Pyricularia grisea]
MLPTPSTSHVDYNRIYEPAEDSFLFLDTISSPSETSFLTSRFQNGPTPLVVEVGTGSGVVIGFVAAQARHIFGGDHGAVVAVGVDVNAFACAATAETVKLAIKDEKEEEGGASSSAGLYLGSVRADLGSALRPGQVDVLLFNPPYVPTPEMPGRDVEAELQKGGGDDFARDSYLLELSYAGGRDGMETTDRLIEALPALLSDKGCAYILLCAQNKPEDVKRRILGFGNEWRVHMAGSSGKQAGWEKLQIIRIWRERDTDGLR